MNVSLTVELEEMVDTMVKGGTYTSASEVVRAGLRLLKQREEEHQARLEALRGEIAMAQAQVADGQTQDGAAVFAAIRRRRATGG